MVKRRKRAELRRQRFWTPTAIYQPFGALIVGPLPGLGLAVWNSFHLRLGRRWYHFGLALLAAIAAGAVHLWALPPLAAWLAAETGLPDFAAFHALLLVVFLLSAMVLSRITLDQLEAYKDRIFNGPIPTPRWALLSMWCVVALVYAGIAGQSEIAGFEVFRLALLWWWSQ